MHRDNEKIDAGLKENYRIEEAIEALQKESSYEMLAHTLTVIRRTMTKKAQMIIAVEPPRGDNYRLWKLLMARNGGQRLQVLMRK